MPRVEQLLQDKGSEVAALASTATVLEAAKLMNDRHIGSVVILDRGRLAGIFTERDVMRRIVADHRNPDTTTLAEVMTTPVACAAIHTKLDEIRQAMREKHIRHMPVVENDKVVGMISIGDLNRVEHQAQEQTIQYLEQYMSVG